MMTFEEFRATRTCALLIKNMKNGVDITTATSRDLFYSLEIENTIRDYEPWIEVLELSRTGHKLKLSIRLNPAYFGLLHDMEDQTK